jgi:hypothetical protein
VTIGLATSQPLFLLIGAAVAIIDELQHGRSTQRRLAREEIDRMVTSAKPQIKRLLDDRIASIQAVVEQTVNPMIDARIASVETAAAWVQKGVKPEGARESLDEADRLAEQLRALAAELDAAPAQG